MKPADKPYFAALMTKNMRSLKQTLDRCTLQVYWEILSPYTLSEITQAWEAHARDPDKGAFIPCPADLIRNITGSYQCQALTAWAKVSAAIQQVGSYDSVAFDDPLIHAVLPLMGGWVHLCTTTTSHLLQRAKEFQVYYCRFLQQRSTHYPKFFYGILQKSQPILIGDQARVLAVMSGGTDLPVLINRKATMTS